MQLRCTFPDNICVQLGFLLIFASSFSKLWTCLHVKKTSSFMYWTPLTCLYYIHSHTSWSRWVTMTDSPNMALSEWPNWHTNNVFKKKPRSCGAAVLCGLLSPGYPWNSAVSWNTELRKQFVELTPVISDWGGTWQHQRHNLPKNCG